MDWGKVIEAFKSLDKKWILAIAIATAIIPVCQVLNIFTIKFSTTTIALLSLISITCLLYLLFWLIEYAFASQRNRKIFRNNRALYEKKQKEEEKTKYAFAKTFYSTLTDEQKNAIFNIFKYGKKDPTYRNRWIVNNQVYVTKHIYLTESMYRPYDLDSPVLFYVEEINGNKIITIKSDLYDILIEEYKGVAL